MIQLQGVGRRTRHLGRVETYTYDGADNLTSRVTPKGETIRFEYDAVNQLLKKTLPGSQVTRYTYDTGGNLTGVTDPDSTVTMTYDPANRLLTTSTVGSSHQPAATLTYTYDKNGNRVTVVDPTATNSYVYEQGNGVRTRLLQTQKRRGLQKGPKRVLTPFPHPPTEHEAAHQDAQSRRQR